MAVDFSEITDSNQDSLSVILGEIAALHEEIHEAVRLLRKHDALLEQFRPLLDRYATPAGAFMAARQARRNGNRATADDLRRQGAMPDLPPATGS